MSDWSPSKGSLGQYRIVRELGAGSTGTVFLAERIHDFEQTVALKVLRWSPLDNPADERIDGEHVILRSLDHPNIVALLDHGQMEDGAPFLVLEYLHGTSIDVWCDAKSLSVRDRLSLLLQVFAAVTYAHSHLVLHGDIKPANIMVIPPLSGAGNPIVKLLDFGISRWLYKGRSTSRSIGATVGYASPEQQRRDVLTSATDVYALGLVMRTLLAGVEAVPPDGKTRLTSAHFDILIQTVKRKLPAVEPPLLRL
jgi:serine/threonine protein kinase